MKHLHRITKISTTLFALSLALASNNAAASPAGASVRATVKDSQLIVIDLTPRDGKAAGYTLPASGQSSNASASLDMIGTVWDKRKDVPNLNGSNTYASVYHTGASVSASTGTWGLANTGIYADGDQLGNARATGSANQMIGVSVAAHTRLIYSGLAELSIDEWYQTGDNRTFSSAAINVGLNGTYQTLALQNGDFTGGYGTRTQDFSLFFDNNTDADRMIYMSFGTTASVDYYTTTPVPEPETYAMLGLGALVVGACARRRRRQARAL
ncbi:PEP-CTERM sorting domain-containing protein [Massilia pseudoviolaceinigra]|uniref:PEP-CTERM sorting domain-containing protein n=1 Tax=Massilia pseudoviolaceinigra TaxID=3057165 RepID=UPI002796CD0C|nr:PEP-CTERM sorting domain-containing protein [Massilia sp. CCM 9206]MDQ1922741.1 PEP-CTERM sorting domain-containing protein [Massilia sp. CCM 9206]